MKIEQLMTRPAVSCRIDQTAEEAACVMWEYDCGCVPIVRSGDEGADVLVGMITDRDICMAAYTQGRRLAEIPLVSAMASDLASCLPEDSVATALGIMETRQLHRLPVVDPEGRLIGIVSLSDLAQEASRERNRPKKEIPTPRIGEVVQAIAMPREPRSIQAA